MKGLCLPCTFCCWCRCWMPMQFCVYYLSFVGLGLILWFWPLFFSWPSSNRREEEADREDEAGGQEAQERIQGKSWERSRCFSERQCTNQAQVSTDWQGLSQHNVSLNVILGFSIYHTASRWTYHTKIGLWAMYLWNVFRKLNEKRISKDTIFV